ncbi:MAG: sigma-70 family RNA polymerase sigma factor, partial [Myxococcota bacterium]
MSMNPEHDDVSAARGGDAEAFARLVLVHGPVAARYAQLWLRDREAARDAVQEAFLDAWLHLDQLRDPAAFPGWLRRIVLKHCDRRTRAGPRTEPLTSRPDEPASDEECLVPAGLHAALETLPAHERVVVALHYFGEIPQREVAAFLELPLGTVKKRLERARRRLGQALEAAPPPRIDVAHLADRIRLFLALRSSDLDLVDVLLDRDPRA